MDTQLQSDLEAIRRVRIFFGHQSVGRDILDGVMALSEQAGVPLPITDRPSDHRSGQASFFSESLIGRNGDPESKCQSFLEQLAQMDWQVDVAIMKFCYVDIDQDSPVGKIFECYAATLSALAKRAPAVTFLPATVPLKASGSGAKRFVKSILGRPDAGRLANLQRSRFNELLRQRFPAKLLFDLALVESTDQQGRRNSFTVGNQTGYSLVADYTSDGGHLNELGRNVVAREFVRVLAAAARSLPTARIAGQPPRPRAEEVAR